MERPNQDFSGNANRPLAEQIAARVGVPLSVASISRFPDGEISVTYEENMRGQDVFIVQPTGMSPNEIPDGAADHDRCGPAGVGGADHGRDAVLRVCAAGPQGPPRVPITAKLVANLLVAAGADRILTIDLHRPQIQGFFDIPVDHCMRRR